MSNHEFEILARKLVLKYINGCVDSHFVKLDDVYVVWMCKTLQNNKAMVSTTTPNDHRYYEVTYNGDKKEVYFDCYDKVINIPYTIEQLKEWGVLNG